MSDDLLHSRWIDLDGPVNVRDLAGLPVVGGGVVAPHTLLRADHLQVLSDADRRTLLDTHRLTDVVDLRTDAERESEGPAPLDSDPRVHVHALSYLPVGVDRMREIDGDRIMPWQTAPGEEPTAHPTARSVYVAYLHDRPDSVVRAMKAVAYAEGSAVVHCAAGKDRTGTTVAMVLDLVGVPRDVILADYLLTGERVPQIVERLLASDTYRANLVSRSVDSHMPREQAIADVFADLDDAGGTEAWLLAQRVDDPWTPDDTAALRTRLTDGAP